ncbi:hypothetical protein B0T16DRAFT_367005 [Cercophora newfieldiana]|uniref:C2H2-type domain-containing protein n=1 Tax=Cercophora newfieldiana TaxID=92897 RepID=A0AA39YFP6_9PEZI|nr:hypothetical protein B0T16DRAFT_367005 [Cercophora newfieldiana]
MVGHEQTANDPPSISVLVARGLSSLGLFLDSIADDAAASSSASSHLARLKLWAGNLGAHRSSGALSLEYRLRDASSIRNHVVALLQDLCESIDTAISTARGDVGSDGEHGDIQDQTDRDLDDYFLDEDDPDASEVDQILADIGHTIDCLLRLSITIRNPAPHDRFKSRAGTEIAKVFEQWDTKHVQDKFPAVSATVSGRLGRAIAWHRQYFKYREEHHAKLAQGLDATGSARAKSTTVASSIPNHLKDPEFVEFSELADENKSQVSRTSYAPSTFDPTQLRVPPIPKAHLGGLFECPFCRMVVSIENRREWKIHVFRDLRPYMCLVEKCQTPEQQYQRRSDWINHMKQDHWRIWNCAFGCPENFSTADEFEQHAREAHQTTENLDVLRNLSARPHPERAKGQCPLCQEFRITSDRQYSSHVGAHLETLALFALPDTGMEEDEEDESGISGDSESLEKAESISDMGIDSEISRKVDDPESGVGDEGRFLRECGLPREWGPDVYPNQGGSEFQGHRQSPTESSEDKNSVGTGHEGTASHKEETAGTETNSYDRWSDDNSINRPLRMPRPRRAPRRLTTQAEANFQCEVKGCGKLFSRSYNFKAHMETHEEKREYPFPCTVGECNKKFVRKTDLQRHHQAVHMRERNHQCEYCSRLFARKDTLRRHMEDGCSKRFLGRKESPTRRERVTGQVPPRAEVNSERRSDVDGHSDGGTVTTIFCDAPECRYIPFPSAEALENHLIDCHNQSFKSEEGVEMDQGAEKGVATVKIGGV